MSIKEMSANELVVGLDAVNFTDVLQPSKWSVGQVSKWLEDSGLSVYVDIFKNNDIDGDCLLSLTEKDMDSMNISSLGHRKKLKRGSEALAICEAKGKSKIDSCKDESVWGFPIQLEKCLDGLFIRTEVANNPSCFLSQGVASTNLRSRKCSDLPIYGRDETFKAIIREVSSTSHILNKMPILSIPGGPGQGKSEVAARMVETFSEVLQTHAGGEPNMLNPTAWLACAVTFNYKTDVDPFEAALMESMGAHQAYIRMITFRLIYTWMIDKAQCTTYGDFVGVLAQDFKRGAGSVWARQLNLHHAVSVIQRLAHRKSCLLIIDESLRPVHDKSEQVMRDCIQGVAGLQVEDQLVIIFTNLLSSPFQSADTTPSGRRCFRIPLCSIEFRDAMLLIEARANKILDKGRGCCWSSCVADPARKIEMLQLLARWCGGRPRLCEMAALVLTTAPNKAEVVLENLSRCFIKYYSDNGKQLTVPAEAVLLAILGVEVPVSTTCRLQCGDTVDSLVGSGVLSRESGDCLVQPPLLLQQYCSGFCELFPDDAVIAALDTSIATIPEEPAVVPCCGNEMLAKEVLALLSCARRDSSGKAFETFDRQSVRLHRLAHAQMRSAVRSNVIAFEGEGSTKAGTYTYQHKRTDWTRASLVDIFGKCAVNTMTWSRRLTFDVSQPYEYEDTEFMEIPKLADTPVEELLRAQYYPHCDRNPGFDWFVVLAPNEATAVTKAKGRKKATVDKSALVVLVTENKFSTDAGGTNSINAAEDIVKKRQNAVKAFEEAGWSAGQIVFRLAAHRRVPAFTKDTLSTLQNLEVMIYGPSDIYESFSPTVRLLLRHLVDIDAVK